jgi:hypothetical protein
MTRSLAAPGIRVKRMNLTDPAYDIFVMRAFTSSAKRSMCCFTKAKGSRSSSMRGVRSMPQMSA